jgi:uncharacterized protein (DUF488 family)
MNQKTIWTIGHSTHPLHELTGMLQSFGIELLADIRNFPGSKRFPHFNKEALEKAMTEINISYVHFKKLGGRRKPLSNSRNTAWRVEAFRGYADYMETEDFLSAMSELQAVALEKRTAIMCSEAVWWRCHRSLVSDFLKFNGWQVMHIMGIGKADEHPYTKPAKVDGGRLDYSA